MGDIGTATTCKHKEREVDQGQSQRKSNFANAPLLAAGSLSLAACGGGGSPNTQSAAPTGAPVASPDPTPSNGRSFSTADAAAARFLLRASLSASESEIASVKVEGQSAWLDRKMSEKNSETAAEFFQKNGFDTVDNNRWFAREQIVDRMIWSQLADGSNGVRKRMALALSNFFVVSANRLSMQWPAQAIGAFWDLLNEHAFGNFRTLLKEVCLSPAMGEFLDVIGSKKADPITGRNPDENFARELLQLFSVGLFELNQDGTTKLRDGEPIETYDNSDVAGLARVFTGYNVDNSGLPVASDPRPPNKDVAGVESVRRPMTADPRKWLRPQSQSEHSSEEKRFLGIRIPAGTDPASSLNMAVDGLFNHPNVGPFFCKQMIQRLVTSNPSSSYVLRVARVFADNGRGERGDLRAVFKAILLDEEATASAGLSDPRFGKLREPVLRLAQFVRTFRVSSGGGTGITRNLAQSNLGQSPFRAPSVFNFFSSTFVPGRSAALENGIVAPEFQLVNEISVAGYLNFLEFTIDGRGSWLNDWQPQYDREEAIASSTLELIDHLDLILLAGQLQPASRNKIIDVVDTISSDNPKVRVQTAILLIMASTDYLIQK